MHARRYPIVGSYQLIAAVLLLWASEIVALGEMDKPYAELVTDGRYPNVVRLISRAYFEDELATGVLITPRHILTVAHHAPTYDREIRDSAWHEANGGDADDIEDTPYYSFVGTSEPESPEYSASEYWVHPSYDPSLGNAANFDWMIIVTDEVVSDVTPAPVMPRRTKDHLQAGAWVRHVSFGPARFGPNPTDQFSIHRFKNTVLTRVLDSGNSIFRSWVVASGGDSGSPVFQRRMDSYGNFHEVVVGIVWSAVQNGWINEEVYNWIRSVVSRIDPDLLSNDYDDDGVSNLDDDCLLTFSRAEDPDTDRDGVGAECDHCPAPSSGDFDTDNDGAFDQCDPCPFPSSYIRFDNLTVSSPYVGDNYWQRSPVEINVEGLESDGRWLEEEFSTTVSIGSRTWSRDGLGASFLSLSDGHHSAEVRIRDGCGHQSSRHRIEFGLDATGPSVNFLHPAEGQIVPPGSVLSVVASSSDMLTGLRSVELWLDWYQEAELGPSGRKLCDLGLLMFGSSYILGCEVPVNFFGVRTLYLKATDIVGNTSIASRNIGALLSGRLVLPPPPRWPRPLLPLGYGSMFPARDL